MSNIYEKIKIEIENRNYRVKKFIPDYAEMGERGFKLSCDNETLKVRTLQLISKALKLPMSFWFQEEDRIIKGETELTYGENSSTIIKRLSEQIDDLMDDKRRLKRENDELRERLGLGKLGS